MRVYYYVIIGDEVFILRNIIVFYEMKGKEFLIIGY